MSEVVLIPGSKLLRLAGTGEYIFALPCLFSSISLCVYLRGAMSLALNRAETGSGSVKKFWLACWLFAPVSECSVCACWNIPEERFSSLSLPEQQQACTHKITFKAAVGVLVSNSFRAFGAESIRVRCVSMHFYFGKMRHHQCAFGVCACRDSPLRR